MSTSISAPFGATLSKTKRSVQLAPSQRAEHWSITPQQDSDEASATTAAWLHGRLHLGEAVVAICILLGASAFLAAATIAFY